MKKSIIITLLFMVSVVFINACTSSNVQASKMDTNIESVTSVTKMSKDESILVAYFSVTGNTKKVAEKIAELTGADVYEIVPKIQYTDDDINWHNKISRTSIEQNDDKSRPEIGSPDIDISKYKTIYLGYPIWWGIAPKIMNTFVEKYNFDGIKVIPFCTSGSSGIGNSATNLSKLAGKGEWLAGERLSGVDAVESFLNNYK